MALASAKFCVILAIITFWLVERPIRKMASGKWVLALIGIMMVIGFMGFNVLQRDGLERIRHKRIIQVDDADGIDFIDFEKSGLISTSNCATPFEFPEKNVCLTSDPRKPVSAVILGDSHALHSFWGLAVALEKLNLNAKLMGKGACMPLLDITASANINGCQSFMNLTLKNIATDPDIKVVVLVHRGRYLSPDADQEQIGIYKEKMHSTLSFLEEKGKKIYYSMPVVEPGFDPRLCIGHLPMGRKPPKSCIIDESEDKLKWAKWREVISEIQLRHPLLKIIDPNQYICSNGQCQIIVENRSLFKDDNHLSYYGSMLIGEHIKLD